jgi:hypothetical protein
VNAFDAMTPTIDEFNSSRFVLSMPEHDENAVANTLLPRRTSGFGTSEGRLRDALERDDRQVLATATILDA